MMLDARTAEEDGPSDGNDETVQMLPYPGNRQVTRREQLLDAAAILRGRCAYDEVGRG